MTGGGLTITPRRKQIIELIARGKSNEEIAMVLGDLCKFSVKSHIRDIMLAYGVHSRTMIAVMAILREDIDMARLRDDYLKTLLQSNNLREESTDE